MSLVTKRTNDLDEQSTREILAELAALRQKVERREQRVAPTALPARRQRRLRRGWLSAAIIATLFFAVAPLVSAAVSFSDINTAGVEHRLDIQAIADAGISTGYADPNSNDPNQRLYQPKDVVTREQMASFLSRLGGLNGHLPVVNAATAINAQNAVSAQNAQSAQSAQTAVNAQTAQTVPDNSITTAKINPGAATTGQVLTATGAGSVTFQAPVPGPPGPPGPLNPTASTIVRAAYGAIPNLSVALTGTPQAVGSVTITAPEKGYIIVSATSTALNYSATGTNCPCVIFMYLIENASNANSSANAGTLLNPPTGQEDADVEISNSYVFAATAAGSYTFSSLMNVAYNTPTEVEGYAQMTAIYVPFDGNGAMPTSVSSPEPTKRPLRPGRSGGR